MFFETPPDWKTAGTIGAGGTGEVGRVPDVRAAGVEQGSRFPASGPTETVVDGLTIDPGGRHEPPGFFAARGVP